MSNAYAALLADVRRFIEKSYPPFSPKAHFFSKTASKNSWVNRTDLLKLQGQTPQPFVIEKSLSQTSQDPPVALNPPPQQITRLQKTQLQTSAVDQEEKKIIPPVKSILTPPSSPKESLQTAPLKPIELKESSYLDLHPPPAIQPFAAEEWKNTLAQLMPALKTYDTVPLPFGARLWTEQEHWLVLFIEERELSEATENFIYAIKQAAGLLLAPIGCLPMQRLTDWKMQGDQGSHPIVLKDLESYLKEPSRKKSFWQELEKLYLQKMNLSSPA